MAKLLFRMPRLCGLLLAAVAAFALPVQADDLAQQLYATHKNSVYRIEVISPGTDKKSSLGTGFVMARGDVLASNFHVVSDAVHEPERYRLEWQGVDGSRGPLAIIAVDVIHDLALLKAEQNLGTPHQTTTLPQKGTALYSMGHPLGLDLAIVPGSANGLLEKSLYDKIHFSGNINPGMSGGPALDGQGRVVGINVATASEGVGFLVPAHFLDALVQRASERDFAVDADLQQRIGEQLVANQAQLFADFLNHPWPKQQVGKFSVPGEISSRLDCWGRTDPATEKKPYLEIETNCSGQDDVFLSQRQNAGNVGYQFFWLESDKLSPRAFYREYQKRHNSQFQSYADETDVGNFSCSVHFVEVSGQSFKANICARPYKRYPGLTDFMVLMAMTGHDREGLLFTLDLSSVSLDNGMKLLQHFLEQFQWQPR
ncbi:trypsin-like peptidase domain-containing protein [Permianibacter sp. IMCC34836]|uniref:S1 family peptidase n=1 Tax=Permianibacter fluminis TaxID=2738515 RepID=UPI001551A150|nr:serine protease [Permianibacter fluminis]NQD36032.1 trypsin-like peptidase domain-containing protein [Permianibacter fluminis]